MITPKRQLCNWHEPSELVRELVKTWGEEGLVWLDGDGSQLGRWMTIAIDPIEQICCRGLPEESGSTNPFEALNRLTPGHWSGWLSYEAGAWIEPSTRWKADEIATLWMVSHDPVLKFDLQKHQLWLEGCDSNRLAKIANWIEKLHIHEKSEYVHESCSPMKKITGIPMSAWKWLTTDADYFQNVNQIKEWIKAGDIFQANLSACCISSLPQGTLASDLFQKLRRVCPAPFAGIIVGAGPTAGEAVISTSPERFLKVLPIGKVETRPIKGTRPRHPDSQKDAEFAADLVCSPKDRAENIMIVDLLRNDLGKVCESGSINVPQLIGLESYQQVHHLTSVVNGTLKADKTWVDLLKACWPGGSISGAPKLRACQRLHELEPTARGPYCGSFIHLDWNGTFDSNILIRSLMLKNSTIRANAGCGIVADSDPTNEVQELKWKLLPLLKALQ